MSKSNKKGNTKKPDTKVKRLPDIVVKPNERYPNIAIPSVTVSGRTIRSSQEKYTIVEPDPEEHYLIHLTSEFAVSYLKDENGDNVTSGYQVSLEDVLKVKESAINQFEFIVMLESAQIPLSYYLISSRNNRIDYYEQIYNNPLSVVFYHIIVPSGNYTIAELLTEIESLLNAKSPVILYSLSYNSITHKTEILTTSLNLPTTYQTEFYFNPINLNTIAPVIGFTKDVMVDNQSGMISIFTAGDQTVNLRGYSNIYIKSNLNSSNIYHPRTGALSDLLAKISIDQPLRTMLHFTNSNPDFKIRINNNHIRLLTLELVDVDGQLINLNGEHWDCTIQVTRKRLKSTEVAIESQDK
jgi:hypothetical protein